MIRNIIWDVDGTLFDTYLTFAACFQAALAVDGYTASAEQITELALVSMTHCAYSLAAEFGVDPDEMAARFDDQYAQTSPASQPPFPHVLSVCKAISEAGGLNLIVTHRGLRSLKLLLEYHQMEPYFSASLSAQEGFPLKPDPAMFIELVNRFSLDPAQTLAVGDREIDIQAGAAAGLRTCAFGDPIRFTNPDYTLQDYRQLLSLIGNEAG